MLDSWGRKCYPGVVPGWVGRAEKKVLLFLLRASPFSYPRKPPSRSSPPNRRNHAEQEGGTDEAGSSKVWLGNFFDPGPRSSARVG